MNNTDISKLSVTELKALAYDVLVVMEQNQNNLKIINAEIQKRNQEKVTNETSPTS